MSIFGNFSGGQSRRDLRTGFRNANASLDRGISGYRTAYGTAQDRYAPFAQSGQQANRLYGNFLGLNGGDAQRDAFSGYQEGPYANFDRDRITQASARSNNARGYGGSGVEAMATARALQQYGQQGMDRYLDRLGGMQGQGFQAANALANLDTGMGNAELGVANQRANLDTQLASAIAGTRSMGMQNAMGLAQLGISAFVPGAAGMSAAGSFGQGLGNMFGSGMNSMFRSPYAGLGSGGAP